MGYNGTHILKKIDRIKAKGDQRRANRIEDARVGVSSLYVPNHNKRVFTSKQVQAAKDAFQIEVRKTKIKTLLVWAIAIIIMVVIFIVSPIYLQS